MRAGPLFLGDCLPVLVDSVAKLDLEDSGGIVGPTKGAALRGTEDDKIGTLATCGNSRVYHNLSRGELNAEVRAGEQIPDVGIKIGLARRIRCDLVDLL